MKKISSSMMLAALIVLVMMLLPPSTNGDITTDDATIPDPKGEMPNTDNITVTIGNAEMSIGKGNDIYEVEQKVNGSTTGNVHHVAWTMVIYSMDGTYDADGWNNGPYDNGENSIPALDVSFESHFYGTGSGGEGDWSSWDLLNYIKAPSDLIDQYFSQLNDFEGEDMLSVELFVRAYSNVNGTLWSQDSVDLTNDIKVALNDMDKKDVDEPLPGFTLTGSVVSITVLTLAAMAFRRREI